MGRMGIAAIPREAGLLSVIPGRCGSRSRRLETKKPKLKWCLPGPMALLQQEAVQISGCEPPGPT